MKIGYPCINLSLDCRSSRTFRLKSYSKERLIETVRGNLDCLLETLRWNVNREILFFRVTSDLVPFASHPVCRFEWQSYFNPAFTKIGAFIRRNHVRISMHPDQFTLINSPDRGVHRRSIRELLYHAQILDLMKLNRDAKIQLHVGGIYGEKLKSMKRFVKRYAALDAMIRKRLVIENDDRCYTAADCLALHGDTGIPVLFDTFHHSLNNSGERLGEVFSRVAATWKKRDGILMVDYSTQAPGQRAGSHANSITISPFKRFLCQSRPYDFDLMLEIKDKEKSALKALHAARGDRRLAQ